jgi:thiol-disulfide isomerase/thioredoxin
LQSTDRPRRFFTWGRLWDVLALLAVAFLAWKWIVVPRALSIAAARPAPRVSYPLLGGGTFDLQRQKGRVVFLDFWASWCTPCKASLPLVEAFARAHPEVDVVAVDEGESETLVAAYARDHDMQRVAYDPQALSHGFFLLDGYPTIVVIDPQSRIRASWAGFNPAVAANMANAERQLSHTEGRE